MLSSHARIVVLALALILTGCGRDQGGPSAPPVSIAPLDATVRPGEILAITGTGVAAFPDSVAALLGTASMTLHQVDDSTLAGVVPAVDPGLRTLVVTLTDTVASLQFTILAATTYADPVAAAGAILDAQLAGFPDTAPEGIDSAAWAAESVLLDSLIADAKATLGDLTPEEQVALARLLAPFTEGSPAALAAPSLMGEPACDAAEQDLLKGTYHGMVGMSASVAASAAGFFSDRLRKTLEVASAASLREMRLAFQTRNERCKVPKQVRYVSVGVRGAPTPFGTANAAGPDRFFKGHPMHYSVAGDVRPVSQQELSKNTLLATVDAGYRKARDLAVRNLSKFPAWLQGIVNSLPPSVAETPPGPLTTEGLAPAQVRIERVSPSSVSLTAGASGDEFTVTSNTTVSTDVPFTYDLVSVTDPTVRKSMSGVLRPFMSATFGASGQVFEGTRSIVNIGGFDYGQIQCGGSRPLHVTGGDKGVWQEFQWVIQSSKTAPDSVAEALSEVEFEAGDHPFSGSWYFRWRENNAPAYVPFTVGLRVSYFDQVTETVKYSSEFWFSCQ